MNIIVACCKNFGIGFRNKLPWHLKKDLKYFKENTIGDGNSAVVMGRKTWLSIPELPKRDELLLTKSSPPYGKTKQFQSINELKQYCRAKQYSNIWITGGQSIYEQFITDPEIEHIYMTMIHKEFLCDSFFPTIPSNFSLSCETEDIDNNIPITFKIYTNTKYFIPKNAFWD